MEKAQEILKTTLLENGILQIFFNRPEALNALNSHFLMQLADLLKTAKDDKKIKALLLTGEGKAFCAGADINHLANLNGQNGVVFAKWGQQVFRMLEQLGKPSLAAINGYALGGGCELAMAATIRIASQKAVFGQPEVKLGVIPGFGGTQRLSRLIGKGRALELCLTGRTFTAEEALAWGLVTEVVAPDKLLDRAHELLQTLLKLSPVAQKSIMTVIDCGYDLSLDDAMEFEAAHFGLCCSTQDKKEGVNAFLQKRAAEFVGE